MDIENDAELMHSYKTLHGMIGAMLDKIEEMEKGYLYSKAQKKLLRDSYEIHVIAICQDILHYHWPEYFKKGSE